MEKQDFVDIVVGGQAGSEGKGALIEWLSENPPPEDYSASIKPGSINAGHQVYPKYNSNSEIYTHRALPSMASLRKDINLMIAPEASFDHKTLFREIKDVKEGWGEYPNLHIDPQAAIIEEKHVKEERNKQLDKDIASTAHGCGSVRIDKLWRSAGGVKLAQDCKELDDYVKERTPELAYKFSDEGRVLIEGTQGTFLSMNQSQWYPYTTSRDCIASSFLSSSGLPISTVADVWAVFRRYPIRVGGNSGPLQGKEISFKRIADRAGYDDPPVEFTSVTGRKRRIFEWSWDEFERSLLLNQPTYIALTFIDYINQQDHGKNTFTNLTNESKNFIRIADEKAQKICGSTVGLVKTGPKVEHSIDLRKRNIP